MLDSITTLLGGAVLGVFAWAFHLGNRVSVLETQRDSIRELIETRFDEVERRLVRIERAMNGHLKNGE